MLRKDDILRVCWICADDACNFGIFMVFSWSRFLCCEKIFPSASLWVDSLKILLVSGVFEWDFFFAPLLGFSNEIFDSQVLLFRLQVLQNTTKCLIRRSLKNEPLVINEKQ